MKWQPMSELKEEYKDGRPLLFGMFKKRMTDGRIYYNESWWMKGFIDGDGDVIDSEGISYANNFTYFMLIEPPEEYIKSEIKEKVRGKREKSYE
ncbi:hypothetical protein M0R36_10620 [bacterium]|jgi:hypothetical protein|nr:hypothetical protein [bacterium]